MQTTKYTNKKQTHIHTNNNKKKKTKKKQYIHNNIHQHTPTYDATH